MLTVCLFAMGSVYAQSSAGDLSSTGDLSSEEELVPLALEGIWENYSRYVIFDTGYLSNNEGESYIPQIVLRMFYQWYNDRAAESSEYTADTNRDQNDTTDTPAQEMLVRYVPLTYESYPLESGITTELSNGYILYSSGEIAL